MKSIYTAIILLATISIFSLAASAQSTTGSHNDAATGISNGKSLDSSVSKNIVRKNNKTKTMVPIDPVVEKTQRVRLEGSTDESAINYLYGMPGQQGREYDRYGYQGLPLSTHSRPCLVSGARRCVQ